MHRLILFVLMFGLLYPVLSRQQKNDLDQVLRLFPGFHVVMVEEFDPDTRAFGIATSRRIILVSSVAILMAMESWIKPFYSRTANPDPQKSWLPFVLPTSSAAASIDSM